MHFPHRPYCFLTARDFAGITVLRSNTGKSGIGSSIVATMMDRNKYHPSILAAKKQAPVQTTNSVPYAMSPRATNQNAAAAKQKPIVAQTKMRTKTRFVRREPMRKMKERMPRQRG